MFSRFLLIIGTPIILTACGESAVDAVKDGFVDVARTTNFSQLLDNRGSCSKTSWDNEKDKMDRKIVIYSCHFKNSDDFLSKARADFVKKVISKYEFDIKNLVASMEARKKEHAEGVAWTKKYYEMHEGLTENDEKVVNEITEKEEKLKKELSLHEETLTQWREESNLEKINALAEKSYPKYDGAIEVFRWVVNDKNEASILDGGLYAQSGDNKKQIMKYNNMNQTFQVIANTRDADVMTYTNTLQKYALFKFITE